MCLTAGTGTLGPTCEGPIDCAPRLVCVGIGGGPACVETCDPFDANAVCPAGSVCQEIGIPGVPVGVCS